MPSSRPILQSLTHAFSAFLRRRRAQGYFGRHALGDSLSRRGPAPATPDALAQALLQAARDDPAAAIARLKSHADGLSAREAAARLARHGPNEVAHEKPVPAWLHLWHCYRNPFNLLLTALATLSYLTEDAKATLVIGAMVLLSTLIRFVQEGRSHRAAEGLKALVGNRATVIRRGGKQASAGANAPQRRELPIRELVPGDLVAPNRTQCMGVSLVVKCDRPF